MNRFLPLILLLSFILNIWGLYPNFYLHQKEPGLLDASDRILINVINNFDFNPNVPPDPYRYGGLTYHFHALLRGGAIVSMYLAHKVTGYNFNVPSVFAQKSLNEIYTKDSIFALQDHLMFVSRLSGVIFGVLSVYLVYLITVRLFKSQQAAILAALSLSVMPLFVRDSHYATPDIPQLFLILLAFLFTLKIWEKPTLKNYLIVGIIIGLQTSLKQFPLSVLPFIYFHFLIETKNFINRNIFIAGLGVFLGYLIGQPFLFVHYREIWSGFTFQLTWYTPDKLVPKPLWQKILPSYFHVFHLKFLVSQAVLIMPLLFGLIGFLYGFIKSKQIIIALLLIPVFNYLFSSLYLAQIYDYLMIPALPFLAILIGLGLWKFLEMFRFSPYKVIVLVILLIIVFSVSLTDDVKADIACSQEINEYQARKWISDNIPVGTKLAYQPGVMISNAWDETLLSVKQESFSIPELLDKGMTYSAMTSGYIEPFKSWQADTILNPEYIAENQFITQVLDQYQRDATLIKKFEKPFMCISSNIYIYKLPEKLKSAEKKIANLSLLDWNFDDPNPSEIEATFKDASDIIGKDLILVYNYKQGALDKYRKLEWFYFSFPIFSEFMNAEAGKKYTLAGLVKQTENREKLNPDGYLRLDFYDDNREKLSTVISPRAKNLDFEKLEVTSIAPDKSKFLRVGFQSMAYEKKGGFEIKNVELFSD